MAISGRQCSSYKLSLKWCAPIASVAALTERLVQGNSTASGRWCIAAPPLTCHCEERSDVAISQYPAASWESNRRNRNCLPEIAPQGALPRASRSGRHGGPSGPRNDKSGNLCIRRCRPYNLPACKALTTRKGHAASVGGKAANGCAGNAATDAIGAHRFIGSLYESAALRRARLSLPYNTRPEAFRILHFSVFSIPSFPCPSPATHGWRPRSTFPFASLHNLNPPPRRNIEFRRITDHV